MNVFRRAVPCLFTFILLTGCASSKVTGYQPMQGEIDRPDRIIVYDFAATAAELPPEVAIAGQGAVSPPAMPAQLAVGRRLGAETAKYLVAELQGMGLTALLQKIEKPQRVVLQGTARYATSCGPNGFCNSAGLNYGIVDPDGKQHELVALPSKASDLTVPSARAVLRSELSERSRCRQLTIPPDNPGRGIAVCCSHKGTVNLMVAGERKSRRGDRSSGQAAAPAPVPAAQTSKAGAGGYWSAVT